MYRILNYIRIKPRSKPPQKNPHILRTPIFQRQKVEKKYANYASKYGNYSILTDGYILANNSLQHQMHLKVKSDIYCPAERSLFSQKPIFSNSVNYE